MHSKVAYERLATRFSPDSGGLAIENPSSDEVQPGRWMAERAEPFAVFVFGRLGEAAC
jgi:hypothetical protein